LRAELVAGLGDDLQALVVVLVVELVELLVVCFGQASFAGHVGDEEDFAFEVLHLERVVRQAAESRRRVEVHVGVGHAFRCLALGLNL